MDCPEVKGGSAEAGAGEKQPDAGQRLQLAAQQALAAFQDSLRADPKGVLAYGAHREEALAKAEVLALRVLADRLEHGEAIPEITGLFDAA